MPMPVLQPTVPLPPSGASPRAAFLQHPGWRRLAALSVIVLVTSAPVLATLQWGLTGAAMSLPPAVLVLGLMLRPGGATPRPAAPPTAGIEVLGQPVPETSRPEAANLTSQVVPVWQRNIDAARQYADQSMSTLLESFSGVTQHLDRALDDAQGALNLDVDATNTLMELHADDVAALTAHTRAAVALKDDMHRELSAMLGLLGQMEQLSREVQQISRSTHLLALNASAEANRSGGGSGSGSMVVAQEVRNLAAQSRACGQALMRHLAEVRARLTDLDQRCRREGGQADDVDVQVEQAARRMVRDLLASVAGVTRASRDLRRAGHEVKADIEKIFVSLQSQDRVSQMLGSVIDDMTRYGDWVHGADDPHARHPSQWLERLDQSYTMEDLRSSHHGNATVQRASSVEFF